MKNNFWLKLKRPILALAPMAGVSDSAFRKLGKFFGADVVYTEMISADALYYNSKKTLELLKFSKTEKPIVCQLFGKRPEVFLKAVKIVAEAGFDGIDINFGCPARKVVAHGGGVTLMRDLNLCRQLVTAVTENTSLPVSVKIRSSINLDNIANKKVTALDFLQAIADLPVTTIMIHGRCYEQGFSGAVDFETLHQAKEAFGDKFIILGNGGINTPEDAEIMLKKTGVDGVGLARGLYGKPWLFKQIKDYLKTGKYQEYEFDCGLKTAVSGQIQMQGVGSADNIISQTALHPPMGGFGQQHYNPNTAIDFKQIKKIVLQHARLAYKTKGKQGIIELRKHLCWYFRSFANASTLREQLVKVETLQDIKNIIDKI